MNITFDPLNRDERSVVLALLANLEVPAQDTTSIHNVGSDGSLGPPLAGAALDAVLKRQAESAAPAQPPATPADAEPARAPRKRREKAVDPKPEETTPAGEKLVPHPLNPHAAPIPADVAARIIEEKAGPTTVASSLPAAAFKQLDEAGAQAAEMAPNPILADAPVKTLGEHLDAALPPPTKEELLAEFQKLTAVFGKAVGTDKAREIIVKLGAANVSGIAEDRRHEAVRLVRAQLAAAPVGGGI